jgi:hypothetical protein
MDVTQTLATPASIDLAAGTYIRGLAVNEHQFLSCTSFAQLQSIMRDPRVFQQPTKRTAGWYDGDPADLADEMAVHKLVQRAMAGAKKTNVPKYAQYIHDVVTGEIVGVLPAIHAWSIDALESVEYERGQYVLVPFGAHLLAIDGETQVTAHFAAAALYATEEDKNRHREFPLAMIVHHGVPTAIARQYFHDLNIFPVRPNTSLGLSMDTRDPIMQVVGSLEGKVSVLKGRIEQQARQLAPKSEMLMTVQSLRQFIIDAMLGMSGVQYGAKAAPVPAGVDLADVERVAEQWLSEYLDAFGDQVLDRAGTFAGSPPVLAAVGAIGNTILNTPVADREKAMAAEIKALTAVRWEKGDHWEGIAGKNGTKASAHLVYNALTNPQDAGYKKIRARPRAPRGRGKPATSA